MGTQRGGRKEILGTGRRWRAPVLPLRAVLPIMLGTAALFGFTAASSAGGPTIEAAGGAYGGYSWAPAGAEVAPGGTVAFKNASAVLHGLSWTSGPETPTCTGVPINEGKTNWSGSCSFAQAGTYRFYCPVHPTEMTGTITVSSSGTITTGPPPSTESPGSVLAGPASEALTLARNQRGGFVRGSIDISQAGVGARLQIGLIAKRAGLLGTARAGTVRVGRLVRPYLQAGRIPFAVPLKRLARRALRLRGRLSLMVKLVVTPTHGEALKLSRGVVVHG
jgi:plastocyanin